MSLAHHATFHAVARQFIVATNGYPHADKLFPWLNQPEQHELLHAFVAAGRAVGGAEAALMELVDVFVIEFERWREEQD